MVKSESSSLEKIGYIKSLPKGARISDYESIIIKNKNGKKITMYRCISQNQETDKTEDFKKSWEVYKSYL